MPGLFHLTIWGDFLDKGMDHEIFGKNSPGFFTPHFHHWPGNQARYWLIFPFTVHLMRLTTSMTRPGIFFLKFFSENLEKKNKWLTRLVKKLNQAPGSSRPGQGGRVEETSPT
jgi:hypothetical protein